MKKITCWILPVLFLFIASIARSQPETQAPVAETENALLWEISGKKLSKPSYLFGTIHLIPRADYFLSEKAREAFKKAKRAAFEIDLEETMDIAGLMPMMMKMYMNNDTTLRDLLTQDEYSGVKAHFEKIGLPLGFLERIKPMFLSMLASEDVAASMGKGQSKESSTTSYEFELLAMAQEQKKEVVGLETAAYQMSMFDSIPYKVQAKMLVDAINSEDATGNDEFSQMVEMYKNQDIQGMQAMMGSSEDGLGKYEDLLLVRRNKNWIPVMEGMMHDEITFFAVGAGHLGGKQGVVNLLREQGYTLKPLR
ncbi:MAG: TraB/GumN family protein [Saprospiraceae bacterium]|nr:TraB/GumN family protein [Saprospiraceae bacterium]